MEKQKNNILIILSLILFVGCNIFGLIDYSLTPVSFMNEFLLIFIKNGNLFTFEICSFLIIPFVILSWYNLRKISLSVLTSFAMNLIVLKLLGWEINIELICYGLNFSLLLIPYILIRQPISVSDVDNINNRKNFEYFVFAFYISIVFSFILQSGLSFGTVVLPLSKDVKAIFIDNFMNIPRSKTNYLYWFNDIFTSDGYVYQILSIIYKSLSILMIGMACLEFKLKNEKRFYINTLLFAYIGSIFGVIIYLLYPAMGPHYFEEIMLHSFPAKSNWIYYLGNDLAGSIYPRNAMPSFHVAFALFMYINSRGWNIYMRSFFAIFLIGTALSTLVLGEHYIIDWIISPALVLIIMCICAMEIKIKDKISIIVENLFFIILWYAFLFYSVNTYTGIIGCFDCKEFSYLMTATLYSFIILGTYLFYRNYKKFIILTEQHISNQNCNDNNNSILQDLKIIFKNNNSGISLLFILSGFAGLMYQVVFGKMMGTVFGSTSIAIYIVLATYMIGLSLGAYLGGKDNSKISPLLKYAFCEILIALYCALTPLIFLFIEKLYYYLIFISPENAIYLASLKIILGIVALVIPTTFMGMTTPILLKHFNKQSTNSISIAHLYTLNTLGAALGAILSGYIIIQQIGIHNSIYLTVAINLVIGLLAIKIFKRENQDEEKINIYFKEFLYVIKNCLSTSSFNKKELYLIKPQVLILVLLLLSGVVNMSLETLFIHALAIVVGNSTYAFSIMLFTFLIGLSVGGHLGKLLIVNKIVGYKVISYLEIIVGISIFIGFNLLDLVPDYLASFQISSQIKTFMQKEFIKACVCFSIMILPTISIGILYSLLMDKLVSDSDEEEGEKLIGYGLAFNTIGNIMGVFIGGLLLINLLGLVYGLKLIIICVLILSLIVVMKKVGYKEYLYRVVIIIIAILIPFKLNMDKITSGSNTYFVNASRGKVIEYSENTDGGLTSVNKDVIEGKEVLTLLTNGKFQGNDSGEIIAQGAFAIAPLMHINSRNNALVIGYGTGMTSHVTYEAGFKNVDIVELSSDIMKMADKYFYNINKNVRNNKNVHTIINDGRNYLKTTTTKYDFISIELTSIWFAGASYLYNKEFYQIAKQKLNENGVLQQWVQLHHMRPQDFMVVLNTIRSEFKYVNLYFIGGQGIIIATNSEKSSEPDIKNIIQMNNITNLEEIRKFYNNDFMSLVEDRVLSPKQTNKLIYNAYKNKNIDYYSTDNNLYLEYNTPKGNSVTTDTVKEINILLNKYRE